ncbi:geranylgeranylglycerol-phosphate geranylgeranyltransferase [uncultured Polaribacter sp.]|uniref:geranylgeranylglycerol-phosphate geranylgeranyltransferase n=1 Tax=uncultured Polaribacter sp. TaxID=174711 RepID=UPI0026022A6B|nr:geranylgeranylglycerol-phosphate geranylgeranyltransferase [uncultured Polaribacter sp.]
MISFLKLIRYKNLLMVLLTMVLTKYALINSFISVAHLTHLEFFILTFSILLITASGYIINDIFDIETDKINKPDKVFITVSISKKKAYFFYYLFNFIGLFLAIILSFYKEMPFYSFIFIGTIVGLYYYSKILKKIPLVGNLLISSFISLVIFIVYWYHFLSAPMLISGHSMLHTNLYNVIFYYALFAFITTLIREIIKDIEDVNGDLKITANTLPIFIGKKRAAKVAFFFSCFLLLFLTLIIKEVKKSTFFLTYSSIFIIVPLVYFMYLLLIAKTKKEYATVSKLLKTIMFFGILSMLLFNIN